MLRCNGWQPKLGAWGLIGLGDNRICDLCHGYVWRYGGAGCKRKDRQQYDTRPDAR